MKRMTLLLLGAGLLGGTASLAEAQEHAHHSATMDQSVDSGWRLALMGQVFPIVTLAEPFDPDAWLHDREVYLTQPAVMFDLASPGRRFSLRTTLDLEQATQPDGEITLGGWGEGFIDRRHPHTVLHELMASWNVSARGGTLLSLSAGKGFAPYGTEDPMGRPVVKYPTNHHLSQILERWTVNGVVSHPTGWSLELGIFGGEEPHDAYDLGNIESFGDSWSARIIHRPGEGMERPWEVSASFASVAEAHGDKRETTHLANGYLRYQRSGVYGLVEASRSWTEEGPGYWSVLAEAKTIAGIHEPYARVELATRPEMHRLGTPETPEYYRYEPGAHADGATRWFIAALGYGMTPQTSGFLSTRPFVEVQYHRLASEGAGVDPMTLFGRRGLWAVSAGFRIYLGGGAMRMGSYGALDPMGTSVAHGSSSSHSH